MNSELLNNFSKGILASALSKSATAPLELWRIQRQHVKS